MGNLGGKKMAVLVGCNYQNTENELLGCINDVISMKQVLIERFEFGEDNIQLLIDEPNSSNVMPTGANIKKALANMINAAREGDVLYFHYSGHGTLIPSLKPNEPHRKDEAIVPCDFNLITDMDFRQLVNGLPPRATFTFLSDSCHSGGLIDQEKEQIGPSTKAALRKSEHHFFRPRHIPLEIILDKLKQQTNLDTPNIGSHLRNRFKEEVSLSFLLDKLDHHDLVQGCESNSIPITKNDQGILLSGCQTNETSADVQYKEKGISKAYGAFSDAIQQVLKENQGPISNKELVMMAREVLKKQRFRQHPCLYCIDDNANAPFLMQS